MKQDKSVKDWRKNLSKEQIEELEQLAKDINADHVQIIRHINHSKRKAKSLLQ